MRLENINIQHESFAAEGAQYLIGMLDHDLMTRYPGQRVNVTKSSEFEHDKSLFLVARSDGVPVACGGLVYIDENTCEIRRMFTEPSSRGRGMAKMILQKLEEGAKEHGFHLIQLETGRHQPEAIILYEHSGYSRVPCFRQFEGSPHSHCYEKRIS